MPGCVILPIALSSDEQQGEPEVEDLRLAVGVRRRCRA